MQFALPNQEATFQNFSRTPVSEGFNFPRRLAAKASEGNFSSKRLDAIKESPIGELGGTPELSEKNEWSQGIDPLLSNLKSYNSAFQTAKMSHDLVDLDEEASRHLMGQNRHFLSSATNNFPSYFESKEHSKIGRT